jgi:uncharacterized repeat protein (TIGR03803 family)
VIRDAAGNLHGTTINGGAGSGTVFKVDPTGHETILYSFTYDGPLPNHYSNLILDSAGNLYGTASRGGSTGVGFVFKVDEVGNETVLYLFTGGADGGTPYGGVIRDAAGNLYGTASAGGSNNAGVVYKVNPAGVETVLYSFRGGADGANPQSVLTADGQGNLYGTTVQGGTTSSGTGAGVVFKIDSSAHETVLYSFTGGSDGGSPYAGVIRDAAGNLYGTTSAGGAGNAGCNLQTGADTETVLYSFTGLLDGGSPYSGLILGAGPALYGTAFGAYNPATNYIIPIIFPQQPGVVYQLIPKQ